MKVASINESRNSMVGLGNQSLDLLPHDLRAFNPSRLFDLLTNYLANNLIGLLIYGQGVVFDASNGVSPDMVFVSAERQHIITERALINAPDLIIEVVSPGETNSERDRQLKRQLYSRRGFREYWVADPQFRTIEVYRLEENVLVLEPRCAGRMS